MIFNNNQRPTEHKKIPIKFQLKINIMYSHADNKPVWCRTSSSENPCVPGSIPGDTTNKNL